MAYENLYDKIQDVSNDISNFVGEKLLKLDDKRRCPFCGAKYVSFIDETDDYYCPECHNSFDESSAFDEKTRGLIERLDKLKESASELSDVAHELEEHLAWDAVELPD